MTKGGESVQKKVSSKNKNLNKRSKSDEVKLEKILVDNFISMQKVMANLVEKFDHLEKKLSNLLDLFEDSAKVLSQKEVNLELKGENQEEILEKLRTILDQNKLIAKGITLLHESNVASKQPQLPPAMPMQKPMMTNVLPIVPQKSTDELANPNDVMNMKKSKVIEEGDADFSQFSQNA